MKFLLNTVVMLVVLILVSRGGNNFVDFSDDKNGAAGCVNDCDNAPENKISNKNGGCRSTTPDDATLCPGHLVIARFFFDLLSIEDLLYI